MCSEWTFLCEEYEMFLILLVVTFMIAVAVSFIVVRMFTTPIDNILDRIIADEISAAWLRYLKFAIYVVWHLERCTGLGSGKVYYRRHW